MNYYDAILLSIPTLLTLGGGIALLTNFSLQSTITISAGLSLVLLAHGLFVRPPVDPESLPKIDSKTTDKSKFVQKTSTVTSDD